MSTNERRKERYQNDDEYRERRLQEVRDRRTVARAARLREQRLRGWKTIDSAPDNETILLYDPQIFWPIVASLKDGHWKCVHYEGVEPRPTHWRYLLEVPLA